MNALELFRLAQLGRFMVCLFEILTKIPTFTSMYGPTADTSKFPWVLIPGL